MSSNGNTRTNVLTEEWRQEQRSVLLSIRAQQISALIETERALEAVDPSFTRRFLTRSERRQLRGERRSVYDNG